MNEDSVAKEIARLIKSSKEPLETEEVITKISSKIGEVSRNKVMYRLTNLRAEGKISGKILGSGKGAWVWWNRNIFEDVSHVAK